MSQVTVTLDKDADRVVGVVKSLYGLSSKDKAIQLIIHEKGDEMLEKHIKPSFVKEIRRIEKQGKYKKFSSIEEMVREIEKT